jgi:hypothetical protein
VKLSVASLSIALALGACQPTSDQADLSHVALNPDYKPESVTATISGSALFTTDKNGKTQVVVDGKTMTLEEYYAGRREKSTQNDGDRR